NFLIQDSAGQPLSDGRQLSRLEERVLGALAGEGPPIERLEGKGRPLARAQAFPIPPALFLRHEAANRPAGARGKCRDRAALLSRLAWAVYRSRATIHSAHIATYGERAVDVFYVTSFDGEKIVHPGRLKAIRERLLRAASDGTEAPRKAA